MPDGPGRRRACVTAPSKVRFAVTEEGVFRSVLVAPTGQPDGNQVLYRLEKVGIIGKGAFGTVFEFKYTNPVTGETEFFALKEMLFDTESEIRNAELALDKVKRNLVPCEVAWFKKSARMVKKRFGANQTALYVLMEKLTPASNHPIPTSLFEAIALFDQFGAFLATLIDCIRSAGSAYCDLKLPNIGYKICPDASPSTVFRLIDLDSLDTDAVTYSLVVSSRKRAFESALNADTAAIDAIFPESFGAMVVDMNFSAAVTLLQFAVLVFANHPEFDNLKFVYEAGVLVLDPGAKIPELYTPIEVRPGTRFGWKTVKRCIELCWSEEEVLEILSGLFVDWSHRFVLFKHWLESNGTAGAPMVQQALDEIETVYTRLAAVATNKYPTAAIAPLSIPAPASRASSTSSASSRSLSGLSGSSGSPAGSVYNHTTEKRSHSSTGSARQAATRPRLNSNTFRGLFGPVRSDSGDSSIVNNPGLA